MFGLLGTLAVLAALGGAVSLVVQAVRTTRSGADLVSPLRRPIRFLVAGAIAAFLVLEAAILANDFSIVYTANHHSSTTPFPFNVATAWAALEGSIVLWGLVLAGFTWVVWCDHLRRPDRLGTGALAVMGFVAVFFFGMMATIANPFETCVEAGPRVCLASSPIPLVAAVAPADGAGPNPLLQNHLLMAIHPPILYLGYVGLTVPFAYAISALALSHPGNDWLSRSKRGTLVAWSFLTTGIVLGGWWAYEVLSWGGYWAWDPVENASLLPWLVATAFLHSSLVQSRRGMLQAWNLVLVISAFALTILGTFLTRSGTIVSVHSFTQSAIGPALLGFLVLVVVGSLSLFAVRAPAVAQPSRMESLVSREGSFLFNNLLLTTYAVVVLVGTIYPLVLEGLTSARVQVGEPFFNRLTVPLSFGLLLAMGVGPVMPWRMARPELVWSRIYGPLQAALVAGAVTVLLVTRVGWVVLAVVIASFLISVIGRHLWVQADRAARARNGSVLAEARRLFIADPGYWGGQLSHVGVALVAVGIAFAANLPVHAEVNLAPGDTANFDGYQLTYRSPFSSQEPNRSIEGARIAVSRDGETLTELSPRINLFEGSRQAIPTPAVYTRWSGDLYLTLRQIDPSGITLLLDSSPLMWLVWLGGLTTAAGGVVAVRARGRVRAQPEPVCV